MGFGLGPGGSGGALLFLRNSMVFARYIPSIARRRGKKGIPNIMNQTIEKTKPQSTTTRKKEEKMSVLNLRQEGKMYKNNCGDC